MIALFGLAFGIMMGPATDAVMSALPAAKAGVGSAVNDTTRMVGGTLGVAILGSILSSSFRPSIAQAPADHPRTGSRT